jgi:hypothetical protein
MIRSARNKNGCGTVPPSALCGTKVEDEGEPRRLFERQLPGLGSLEDLVHESGGSPVEIHAVGPVHHQGTGLGKLRDAG